MDKKAKAEAKRVRRSKQKQTAGAGDLPESPDDGLEAQDVEQETSDESN